MNTLFETRTGAEIRRDAIHANEQLISRALRGSAGWELTDRQRRLVELLRFRQGRTLAMPSAELEAALDCDDRAIRGLVRDLVMSFHLPIVASRDADCNGFFFAVTAEERVRYTEQYIQEGRKLFARAAIIRNRYDLVELLGQHGIDLGNPQGGTAL